MTPHLEATLQQDLDRIRGKVEEMGDLAERAVRAAIRSVVEGNRQLAYAVILRDQYIDEAEKQLDRLCVQFLVRHQPAASLLRFAYATLKVNLELERVGDYAEGIAREALKLAQIEAPLPVERMRKIGDLAVPMLHDAIRAFVTQDPDLARRTIESDEVVDLQRDHLTSELMESFRAGTLPLDALYPLVMVARRLERVSDQARNVSMETLYMCTGEIAKHPGSNLLRVLFVDEQNACRSVIAEAIGNRLAEPGFAFSSAGLDPRPIDPRTTAFMAARGFEVARFVPRALTQVPNLEHEDVIVLLAPEVKRAFPRRPRSTVLLDWPVLDPSAAEGSEDDVQRAYEETFEFIDGHIHDLVSAIKDTSRG
jgi:phosphate transport system protein